MGTPGNGGWSIGLAAALLTAGCASLGPSGPRLTVDAILDRSRNIIVSEADGFREARYSLGSVREGLRNVCILWPLERNRVNSSFGRRWGRRHQGVDLRAPVGTPVLAALPGRVVYVGSGVRGYGKLIVLKHARGLSTVYAHNSEPKILPDQMVSQGQVIALSGATGRVSGPHLHFEIRDHGKPINPMAFLIGSVRAPAEARELCAPPSSSISGSLSIPARSSPQSRR